MISHHPVNPADRAAVDNMHALLNQELAARVIADLTGTPTASWRDRVKAWWASKTKTVVETTGAVSP